MSELTARALTTFQEKHTTENIITTSQLNLTPACILANVAHVHHVYCIKFTGHLFQDYAPLDKMVITQASPVITNRGHTSDQD